MSRDVLTVIAYSYMLIVIICACYYLT